MLFLEPNSLNLSSFHEQAILGHNQYILGQWLWPVGRAIASITEILSSNLVIGKF